MWASVLLVLLPVLVVDSLTDVVDLPDVLLLEGLDMSDPESNHFGPLSG